MAKKCTPSVFSEFYDRLTCNHSQFNPRQHTHDANNVGFVGGGQEVSNPNPNAYSFEAQPGDGSVSRGLPTVSDSHAEYHSPGPLQRLDSLRIDLNVVESITTKELQKKVTPGEFLSIRSLGSSKMLSITRIHLDAQS
jgi:hypothetical protein